MHKAVRVATSVLLVLVLSGIQKCHNYHLEAFREFHLGVTPGGSLSFTVVGEPNEQPGQCSEPDCSFTAPDGADLALVAVPAFGFRFVQWRGNSPEQTCSAVPSESASATLSLNTDEARIFCVAEFALDGPTVQLVVSVTGAGTVTTDPAQILECDDRVPSCSAEFPIGQFVRLTPTGQEGWHFVSWSGDCEGRANFQDEVELNLVGAATCGATFQPGPGMQAGLTARTELGIVQSHSVLVHTSFWAVASVGNPDPALTYSFEWEPIPAEVCSFWARDDAMSTPDADWWRCVIERDARFGVTVRASDGETKVLAMPVRAQSDDGTLRITDVIGAGRVLDLPDGAAINCRIGSLPEECSETYAGGASVNLRAQPDPGHAFATWGLDCAPFSAQRDIMIDVPPAQGRSCTATFVPVPGTDRTLTVRYVNGAADRSIVSTTGEINCGAFPNSDCTEDFTADTDITLLATPAQVEWLGCNGTAPGGFCTVRVDSNREVVATFAPRP